MLSRDSSSMRRLPGLLQVLGYLLPIVVLLVLQSTAWTAVRGQTLDPDSPYSGYQTEYSRPAADLDLHLDEPDIQPNPLGGPEQVFLTQADKTGTAFTISWSSNRSMASVVLYSREPSSYELQAKGASGRYEYADYTSGLLHHVTISGLEYGTKYYYKIGTSGQEHLTFTSDFTTPPAPGPNTPIKFSIVGDLGQTYASNRTLSYLEQSGGQFLLNVGDFSYADGYQPRWDTWGRMMTRYSSRIPWFFTYGNHEIEFDHKAGASEPHEGFLSANSRFSAPWESSGGVSPIYSSLNIGPAHIIALNSYISLAKYSPQYEWLLSDLSKVDRTVTPWVFIITHSPWYNTFNAHYLEGEVQRAAVEYFVRKYRVDAVFSGHVHAYERFQRLYYFKEDSCAPLYITIGDGGNREGPADVFQLNPKPSYSAYREGSFGFGTLEIFNSTSAKFKWHRNEEREEVVGDVYYLDNLGARKNCPQPAQPQQPTYPSESDIASSSFHSSFLKEL